MVRLVISGIAGRMGKRIGVLASKDREFEISGGLESRDNISVGKDIGEVLEIKKLGKAVESDFVKASSNCDILIEFTSPSATMEHLEVARKHKIGVVIGTTGLSPEQIEKVRSDSKEIPILFSPNMSVGANILFKITEEVAKTLGKDYETRIIEAHHKNKKDAPSGTAKRLGEAVLKTRGKMPPIESIREGDIVGDHSVIFTGENEKIELKHSAFSRDMFAKGALDAAKFLKGKKSGFYTMFDVINL